jgi:hypothetical protein
MAEEGPEEGPSCMFVNDALGGIFFRPPADVFGACTVWMRGRLRNIADLGRVLSWGRPEAILGLV